MEIIKKIQDACVKAGIKLSTKTNTNMQQSTIEDKQRKPFALWEKAMIGLIGGTILMAILSPFVSASNTSQLADPLGLVQVTGLTSEQQGEISLRQKEYDELKLQKADYDKKIEQSLANIAIWTEEREHAGGRMQELDLEMAQIKAGKTVTGTGSFQ